MSVFFHLIYCCAKPKILYSLIQDQGAEGQPSSCQCPQLWSLLESESALVSACVSWRGRPGQLPAMEAVLAGPSGRPLSQEEEEEEERPSTVPLQQQLNLAHSGGTAGIPALSPLSPTPRLGSPNGGPTPSGIQPSPLHR